MGSEDSEPSMVQDRKVIEEKEIGDGADEREKFLKQQEEEAAKIREDMRIMNEWKAKQKAKEEAESKADIRVPSPAKYADIEESNNSSSYQSSTSKPIVVAQRGSDQVGDSYTSDEFEDASMSNSSSKVKSLLPKQPTSQAQKTGPQTKPLKKIEESSDIYEDDDFESLSRS